MASPIVSAALTDQISTEDTLWVYQIPADAFSDADGDALTYSATLADGSPLPGWLEFDAATRTFSGTPTPNFNGNIGLTVTAYDGSLSASDTFILNVTPVNDAATGGLQIMKPATEFRVNTVTLDMQSLPSVTSLKDGGWIITWVSEGQDGSGSGIYAQRYSASGLTVNGEFRVNSTALGSQTSPIVGALPDGGWLATWTSFDQDGSGGGIYAQRYDVNGNSVGAETLINTTTALSQEYSAVSVLPDGGWVVTWNSAGQDGSGLGIFGQRFSANGTAIGSEFQVNTYTTSDQWWPASAALSDGGWVVTWHSEGQDGSLRGVYAQRYDSNGAAVGTEFLVNTVTASFQETPKIAALPDGGWVITWQSYGQDGSWSSIHGQRYAANGSTVGSEFQANTYTDHQQIDSWVSSLADGGWVVTWVSQGQDNPVGDTFARGGIYSQRYASDGTRVGSEFLVNTKTADSQYYGRVAALADGGWVVTWQADNQDGSGFGIYGQRYAANGLAQEPASLPSDFSEDRTLYADASLITDPDGVGAINWQWQRSTDNGLNWANIANAVAANYTLGDGDVGQLVRVAGAYTDALGTVETVYSQPSTAVINVNDAPLITSNGGGDTASVSISENTTAVTTVTAADFDANTTLTYAISGGVDAALFDIDAATGALSFKATPNFEDPADAGANNVYDVVVQVSDGSLTDTQAIAVNVTNALEVGDNVEVVKVGTEFLVNTQTAGVQQTPTITGLANGGFVVSWEDRSGTFGDSSGSSIKAQIFSADGSKLGAEFLVNTQTANSQYEPTITSLASGGFVVSWQDTSGTGDDNWGASVKAQVFSADGSKVGTEFLVNTHIVNNQYNPTITGLANGSFVVSWTDYSGTLGDNWPASVKAQVFGPDGTKVGTEFLVNTEIAGEQSTPAITGLSSGGFVVSWLDRSGTLGDSSQTSIKAQLFTTEGIKVGTEFLVNTETAGEQRNQTITGLVNGDFVISWHTDSGTIGDSSGASVKAQLFRADGTKVGAEFLVNTQTVNDQYNPTITGLVNGGFVVSWLDNIGDGSGTSIKAQVFSADGAKVGTEFLVNTQTADFQLNPKITDLANGGFVVSWFDTSGTLGDSSVTSIKAQIFAFNSGPVINSNGGGATAILPVAENTNAVTTVTATDPDANTTLSYSISGGADSALFDINAATGALSFKAAPNYEAPTDAGGDNVYDVEVQVSDGTSTDTQAIAVTVTNANDAPVLATPIFNQTAVEGIAWTYQLPSNAFTDADGDTLTYTVTMQDDTALPDWLTFDPATETLSGTAPVNSLGSFNVRVTASDGQGSATDVFVINVTDVAGQLIDGTDASETLTGTVGADVINGLGGNDTLYGRAGDDVLNGGGGSDNLYGENHNDIINGGADNDYLNGGEGDDILNGDDGDDYLVSEAGSDVLRGGVGNDRIYSATYTSNLFTRQIETGSGNDIVEIYHNGTTLSTSIDLGEGNDLLSLSQLNNEQVQIALGSGQDRVELRAISGTLTFTDFVAGPQGDILDWSLLIGGQLLGWDGASNPFGPSGFLRLVQSGADTLLQVDRDGSVVIPPATPGMPGPSSASFTTLAVLKNVNAADLTAFNFGGFSPDGAPIAGQLIDGTDASETLTGTVGADVINGLGGNDTLYGRAGDDVLNGGGGSDNLYGENHNDIINGGADNDYLNGGEGDDILNGDDGDDYLVSEAGSDVLRGGVGNDRIYSATYTSNLFTRQIETGSGNDIVEIYHNGTTLSTSIDLGEGNDLLSLSQLNNEQVQIALGSGQDRVELRAISGTLTFTDFVAGPQGDILDWSLLIGGQLLGWDGASNPFGPSGFLRLVQSGADTLLQVDRDGSVVIPPATPGMPGPSSASFTTLAVLKNVNAADLTAFNFGGFDPRVITYFGTQNADQIVGSDRDDVLDGLAGDDRLTGGAGNDIIYGGDDNDTINGEAGNDLIEGGDGNDSIISNSGSDVLRGGAGNDYIEVIQRIGGLRADVVVEAGVGDDLVILDRDGAGTDIVDLGEGNDRIIFRVTATSAPALVTLGAGRDVFEVQNVYFSDTLFGSGSVEVVVTDFQAGPNGDSLDLNSVFNGRLAGWDGNSNPFGPNGYFRLLQNGSDTVVQIDVDGSATASNFVNLVTLKDVVSSQLDATNFGGFHPDGSAVAGDVMIGTDANDILTGSVGADSIYGNGGSDTISGMAGNDIIYGGADNDVINGGAGNDRIDGGDGDDQIISYIGSDILIGGSGNDYINATHRTFATRYDVEIYAGSGNDIVELNRDGYGTDIVDLGEGDDTFIFALTAVDAPAQVNLGEGRDKIIFWNYFFSSQPQPFGSAAAVGSSSIIIKDFLAGAQGDNFELSSLLNRPWSYTPILSFNGNPFGESGYLRLVQAGADTLVQIDADGSANGANFVNLTTLLNVTASDLVAANFDGFAPQGITYLGTQNADQLVGSDRSDVLDGLGGNDTLTGGAGNDRIDGGAGIDTAVYDGSRSDYTITTNLDGSLSVADNRTGNPNGTDALVAVELLNIGGTLYAADGKPLIISNGGVDAAAVSIAENSTSVTRVVATSLNANASLAYSIVGGADAARFQIDPVTGELSFKNAPDFEAPADAGTNNVYNVEVQASDGINVDVQVIAVTVTNINDAPVVATAITDQSVNEDTAWSYTVPAGTFSDVDGDALTYTATAGDGSALPAWLKFDEATRIFSGTPTPNFNGDVSIKVTASDPSGLTASDTFVLTVNPVEDEATGTLAVTGTAEEGGTVSADLVATDADGAITGTTYQWQISATGVDGWTPISGATTATYAIASDQSQVGKYLRVVATTTDALGGTTAFTSAATVAIANVNDAPTVAALIADQSATEDAPFSFVVPAGSFADVDPGDVLSLSATLANGSPLPAWLTFNPATMTFSGTPLRGDVGTVSVRVTATDVGGLRVSDDFNLTVAPETIAPTAIITDNVPGTAIGTVLYTVTFSETVTGLAANDFVVTNGTVSSVTGSGTSYVVAVAPTAGFEGSLALSLNAAAVIDKAGNANAAVNAAAQLVDTRAPVLTTITPAADSIGVAVATNISLAYSEAIRAGTGVIELRTAAGVLVESFNVATSNRLSFTGSTLTIDPTASLNGGTQYRLTVPQGAVLDTAGNAAAALATYAFTTQALVNIINGTAVANTLNGTAGDDEIYGFGGNDTLNGNAGNDLLDGGSGVDRMAGGAGDDIYVVDNAADAVTEAANAGIDLVRTTRNNYTLTTNVENLTYVGDATFTGTGNGLANRIQGGIGNDAIDGGAGADTMIGGIGNDRYVVDNVGDVVVEQASEGTDMVTASMSYVLGANVENLTLSGNAALNGTGNAVANIITGNNGANILRGAGGADTLNGGAGTDTAAFEQAVANYAIDHSGTAIIVSDLVGGEGTDTLTAIETLSFLGSSYNVVAGTGAANVITGGAGSQAIFGLGGADTINGGAGNDIVIGGLGNDNISMASDTGGRDFIDGGAGEDTFTLLTATGAENFVIYTRAAAQQAIAGLIINPNSEIVITRNGAVIAELDNVEEIVVSSLRVTSPAGANGGAVAGDTVQVVGDFNQTSLNFNTITVNGTTASDTVDITGLQSEHRIVFTGNGGTDNVVGNLRPQDIFVVDSAAATTSLTASLAASAATSVATSATTSAITSTSTSLQALKQAAVVSAEPVTDDGSTQMHRLHHKEVDDSVTSLLRDMFDDSKSGSLFRHWDATDKRQEARIDDHPSLRHDAGKDDIKLYDDSWSDVLIRRPDSWHAEFEYLM